MTEISWKNHFQFFLFVASKGCGNVERLFPVAGLILSDKQNRLNPENAELNPENAEIFLFIRENLPKINFQY